MIVCIIKASEGTKEWSGARRAGHLGELLYGGFQYVHRIHESLGALAVQCEPCSEQSSSKCRLTRAPGASSPGLVLGHPVGAGIRTQAPLKPGQRRRGGMKQVFQMQQPVLPSLCASTFKPGSEQGFFPYVLKMLS